MTESDHNTAPGSHDLAVNDADEARALSDLLSGSTSRFVLASAVCDDLAVQRAVINELAQSHPGTVTVDVQAISPDPFAVADRSIVGRPTGLFVTGLTSWLGGADNRLRRAGLLNATRERWAERFPCPVVLWMNQTTAQWLALHAPDLWRYRSHRFEFLKPRSLASTTSANWSVGQSTDLSLTPQERADRMAELTQRLASLPADPPASLQRAAAGWRLELASHATVIGDLDAADALTRQAKSAIAGDDTALLAAAISMEARIAYERGNLPLADRLGHQSLELAQRVGPPEEEANALGRLGLIARARGDLAGAERWFRAALEVDRRIGRLIGQALDLDLLGLVAQSRGDLDAAERSFLEALEIHRRLGNTDAEAPAVANLGVIAQFRGDLDNAERMLCESLEMERRLGRLDNQAAALGHLGEIAQTRGDLGLAARRFREALEIEQRLGQLDREASILCSLGMVAMAAGDAAVARERWTRSRELYSRLGMSKGAQRVQDWLDGTKST